MVEDIGVYLSFEICHLDFFDTLFKFKEVFSSAKLSLDVRQVIILGIDPGTATTGYGLIEVEKTAIKAIEYGCILTPTKQNLHLRLKTISHDLRDIINQFKPDVISVEQLFFCNNSKTALSVGHARGVILLAAADCDITLEEYTPLQVKQGICGYGKADKKQVQEMVKILLNLKSIPRPDDAADALAVAICHANSYKIPKK